MAHTLRRCCLKNCPYNEFVDQNTLFFHSALAFQGDLSVLQPVVTQKSEKRVPGIDLLRGLCIVAVVLHHINLRIHFRDGGLGHLIGPAANRVLFWNGYYGVRVFFVISGFLITTWSLKRWGSLSRLRRRQFYLMRFARIVPCLAGLLVLL